MVRWRQTQMPNYKPEAIWKKNPKVNKTVKIGKDTFKISGMSKSQNFTE